MIMSHVRILARYLAVMYYHSYLVPSIPSGHLATFQPTAFFFVHYIPSNTHNYMFRRILGYRVLCSTLYYWGYSIS